MAVVSTCGPEGRRSPEERDGWGDGGDEPKAEYIALPINGSLACIDQTPRNRVHPETDFSGIATRR